MKVATEEDPNFKKILAFLLKSKGFNGQLYKPNYIKRRVAVRMRAIGATSYLDYLKALEQSHQEPTLLLDRLTIHVTEFFRDPDVYQVLKTKILPELTAAPGPKIRVWCAGCSTGEEPYSVAMMLKEWSFSRSGADFDIFATDIDATSVRTAQRGEYPVESLNRLSKQQVARWFFLEGQRSKVIADLKHHVHFSVRDLLSPWGPEYSGFHLIFCRNLLIYLTSPEQQKLYEQFASALEPGGYLVLGLTETLMGPSRRFFKCVDVRHRIYQLQETANQTLDLINKD
ncbi:MAG TPA: protein-glutamate O-methyltransferase CheR [bacterium]|nr:protein-glutamate O-methyltransferase CheR [bacterium]